MIRELDNQELGFVFGGDGSAPPETTGPEIVVTAPQPNTLTNLANDTANAFDSLGSGLGWVADGAGIAGGYLTLSAAAQGGADAPNDVAAAAAWATAAAAKTGQAISYGLASTFRYAAQP